METKQLIEIGTRVIVRKRIAFHLFEKGDICTCVKLDTESYQFKNEKGIFSWMVEGEFEIIVPEKPSRKTDNSEKPNKAK